MWITHNYFYLLLRMLLVLFHLLTLMPGSNDLKFQITAAKENKKFKLERNY